MFLHNDEYVVGVDLGTTNTCAAIMTSTTHLPQVVSYPNNLHVFKSCVRYGTQIDVGEAAYNCLINNCPDVVKNSKRIIGRYYDDEIVQRCKREHQCGVDIEKIDNKPVFSMSNSVTVSPSDVSAEIVKRAIEMTDEYMKKHFNDNMKCVKVAVAFPAHFNNNQRTATLLAVEKAGIPKEKLTMLNEPSAAAFYYCKSNSIDNQTILIYDLGGGTFDLSIIKVKGNDYRVIKYAGDPFLGGADFDSLLAKVIMRKYEESYGVPLINTNDQSLRRLYCVRLNEIAEQTKMLLSCWNNTDVDLSLFQVQSKARGSLDSDSEDEDCINITIEDLNDCIRGLIDRTKEIIVQCLNDCQMSTSSIDRVVLIGGSTRLQLVKSFLIEMFGAEKLSGAVNPDEAVACGACQSLVEELHLTDRIVYSLGQFLKGNRIQCLIPCQTNTNYTSQEIETHPACDYSFNLYCAIYQGNAKRVRDIEKKEDCILIGEYSLTGFDNARVNEVTFLTTFTIDEWGIIHVIEKYKEKQNKVLKDAMFRWEEPIAPYRPNSVNLQRG